MNRFLGISYVWDRAKGSCKANAAAYIERVARRFGLEDIQGYMRHQWKQDLKSVKVTLLRSQQRK